MPADVYCFDSDKAEEAIARRGLPPDQAQLIRDFLADPKLRVQPSRDGTTPGLSPEGPYRG